VKTDRLKKELHGFWRLPLDHRHQGLIGSKVGENVAVGNEWGKNNRGMWPKLQRKLDETEVTVVDETSR
jgi:hypothetical protein